MGLIIEHKKRISTCFEGTIIDIETVGEFCGEFAGNYPSDSREYSDLRQIIFGYISRQHLCVYCAKGAEGISELRKLTKSTFSLNLLERPFYAFNCHFEMGVLFHYLDRKIVFDGELQRYHESKAQVVWDLNIDNYDDPFPNDGNQCRIAWEEGEFEQAIAHNRACLLKERDILLLTGAREPDEMIFVKG